MSFYELNVKGMTCDSCVIHVEQALTSLEGVTEAKIESWQSGKALISTSEHNGLSEKTVAKAIKKAGYKLKGFVEASKTENHSPEASWGGKGDYDLAVIGTGGGGMAAAIEGAKQDKKVILIEKGTIGGTCVNVGCIPSKALLKPAHFFYHSGHSKFPGVQIPDGTVDWLKLEEDREALAATLRKEKYEDVLKTYPQITLKQEIAHFKMDSENYPIIQLASGETITAHRYVTATGSRPFMPDIPGLKEIEALDSTSALFLKKKPKSLIIIGGGFIALEIGQAFSRLGVQISIHVRSRLLSHWERIISDDIRTILEKEGVKVHTGDVPIRFFQRDGLKGVEMKDSSGNTYEALAEEILIAIGRTSNTESLNLEGVGVKLEPKSMSIAVNEYMQSTNPYIYAAGDVSDIPNLVYLAAKSGKIASQHALNSETKPLDLSIVPEVIFTDPQIARVGLTEEKAEKLGHSVKTSVLPLSQVPKAIVSNSTEGFVKLVIDGDSQLILGAHILSENAGELIQTVTMAVSMGKKYGFTVQDFQDMLFPYLTEVEGLKLAAQTVDMDVKQLSCCAG